MINQKGLLVTLIIFGFAFVLTGCGKKTTTTTTENKNTVVTEAPYTMESTTKVFSLKLINGLLNYKTMTFHAGDRVEIRLTSDDQPVDFRFQEVADAASTNGIFGTNIQADDKGGTYHLICKNRECGSITLTVVPNLNTNVSVGNTNQAANTNTGMNINASNQVTKVELQRIPANTTFSPTNTYETTTSFHIGDQFGVGVTGNFASGAKSTFSITNSKQVEIEPQSAPTNLQNGTNGTCCYSLPSTVGSYNVQLYINGVKSTTVPITLVK